MSQNPTHVVIFDIGGILVSDTWSELFQSHFSKSSQLESIMKIGTEAWNKYKVGKLTEDEFWNEIIAQDPFKSELILGGFVPKDSTDDQVLEYLKTIVRTTMVGYDESFQVARKLFDAKIPLGLLSNHSNEWADFMFQAWPDFKYFDLDISCVSSRMGLYKPNHDCYNEMIRIVMKKYPSIEKHQIVFIDDKKKNTLEARNCGLTTIDHDARKETGDQLSSKLAKLGIKF